MYNLLYYQIVLQFCSRLTDGECDEVIEKFTECKTVPENGVANLGAAMALVLNNLDRCKNFRQDPFVKEFSQPFIDDEDVEMSEDCEAGTSSKASADATAPLPDMETKLKDFEIELQSLCLPYLRNAALLRHHIYHQELPEVKGPELEFARLVYFLELVTKSMDWKKFHAAKALCFAKDTELSLPIHWCKVLMESRPPHDTTRELIMSQHSAWHQPQLLALPREYERLFTVSLKLPSCFTISKILFFAFQYYYEQACLKCSSVPKESSICLICGKIVCLKQMCCKEQDCCEAVRVSFPL